MDGGEGAETQGGLEVEGAGDLRVHEREQESFDRSSSEEICPSASQLPRARTAQDEPAAVLLDEEVNLVQEPRQTMYFIHEDRSDLLLRDFFFGLPAEQLGRTCIPQEEVGFQEIDAPRIPAEEGAREGALAGLAGAEEEKRACLREIDNPLNHPAGV